MKEASWNDCLYSNSAIKITPDKEKARSLIETAEERLTVLSMDLNEKTKKLFKELDKRLLDKKEL